MLEKHYLQFNYTLNLQNLGYRRIEFLISTQNGKTLEVAKQVLKREEIVSVYRTVGQHAIDLKAEVIVKSNPELLELLELVKGIDGVADAKWTEIVSVVGKKTSIPLEIIDKF